MESSGHRAIAKSAARMSMARWLDDLMAESPKFFTLSDPIKRSKLMFGKLMVWDKTRIKAELKRLHRGGANLSYNALAKKKQSLVSAAAYHFGSYRRAVEAAGIDYAHVIRRPRWTKQGIIQLIKNARRKGDDLHWAAVTKRRDELGRAAFAALQPRLFGKWDRALHGAGLDADEVSRYRKWDKDRIVFELRSRHREHEPL